MKNFMQTILLLTLSFCITAVSLTAQQSGAANGTSIITLQLQKVKEISREVAMPKNGEVYIENHSRNIVVKIWDQPKVKIITTVQYDGENSFTEDEWFEKANVSLKILGSSVKIKAGLVNNLSAYTTNLTNVTTNGLTEVIATEHPLSSTKSPKKLVTVYLPAGSKIDIESKYSEITLPANIGDVNVDISNGNLDTDNLGKCILRSKYAIVNMGDIKTAEIEFTGGRFIAKNIDDLDIDSKYSTIELALAKKAVIRSTNDEYEFEEVGEISGQKNYGNLRITRLLQKIELEGANADIKIRNISPSVSLIKIDDKYADIRLPVKNTKNYSVDFTGAYSAVYGNFEKKIPLTLKLSNLNTVSDRIVSDTGLVPRTSGSVNTGKNNINTLGNLTAITVEGRPLPTGVTGTITGGTFSGSLSSYRAEPAQAITSLGNLTNLTVSGVVTPANGQISITTSPMNAINITGYGTAVQNGNTVNGVRTADTYRTPTGIITGGTYVPFNRAYSYAGDNDTPTKFTASVGDGKGLKIELKCPNCTVDFK